jgi:hypothetical protein
MELVDRSRDALAKDLSGWGELDAAVLQSHLRAFAMRLGRTYAAGLLVVHATDRLKRRRAGGGRPAAAAGRYAVRWLSSPPPSPPTADELALSNELLATVIQP